MRSADKNRKMRILFLSAVALLAAVVFSASALSLGIAPSRKAVEFSPGVQQYSFKILNNEKKSFDVFIYPGGELADFFILEKNIIHISHSDAEKEVFYKINLPASLRPGLNRGELFVMEASDSQLASADKTDDIRETTTISTRTAIAHQLFVNVPYPGLFAEGELFITGFGSENGKIFTVSLFNRGSERFDAYADIIIKGPTNEELARVSTDRISLDGGKQGKLSATWVSDLPPGNYYAEAVVHYNDKYFTSGKIFSLGSLTVFIDSLSAGNFRLGSIAKLDVLLRSVWNEPIKNVFGEMRVLDKTGNVISQFNTSLVDIPAKGTSTISGYWDTGGLPVGDYDVKVIAHYSGKTAEALFEITVSIDKIAVKGALTGEVVSEKGAGGLEVLLILVVVLIIANITLFMYVSRKRKNKEKEGRERMEIENEEGEGRERTERKNEEGEGREKRQGQTEEKKWKENIKRANGNKGGREKVKRKKAEKKVKRKKTEKKAKNN